ncbi:MAG: menaquinone biosynthesis decarboxylase [Acidobacteriia bacterium]|nr:menaquinone biosynthesis decarboxylase [Terriglobia bacterium]
MAYKDLREFIATLEKAGELKRITAEVDCELEVTEITDRISKAGGPALLFEKVKGHSVPVLINALGSEKRMLLALEASSYEEVAGRIEAFLDFKNPQGLIDKIKLVPQLMEMGSFFPKAASGGLCQEVVLKKDFDLNQFPILKCWPQDAGRFITFPLVFTQDPQTGRRNCGVYRMQVYDGQTTGMHWQIHKHGAEHFRAAKRRQGPAESGKQRLEVAVAIGSDPATMFAGVLPLPEGLDEMMISGFLRREPVAMVRAQTVDVQVPANAEIVLEGYVNLDELRKEGPFGDHTGFYSLEDMYPVFHLTCITHRRQPIYCTTIVGRPPMEDCHMGYAIERIFLPLMRKQFPEIVDYHMPFEGIFHNLMIVSIRKSYPGQARKVMNGIWSLPQAMFTKCIVVVDEDVNVRDPREVVWKVLNHIDPERDIQFTLGPVDSLDHSSRLPDFGSKMGIDGTTKRLTEGFARPWPDEIRMDPETVKRVNQKLKDLGLSPWLST